MFSRRQFLYGTGAALTGLPGCSDPTAVPVTTPDVSVDIHTHFFNGLDVPATGFLTQVMARPADRPVDEDAFPGLINLLKFILLSGTPSAVAEYDEITGGGSITATRSLPASDRDRVARGVSAFEGFATGTGDAADRRMLAILQRLAPPDGPRALAPGAGSGLGAAVAARVYPPTFAPLAALRSAPLASFDATGLLATLRWVGLMTRSRRAILAEFKRLYGAPGQIAVMSPSFVDFTHWLHAEEGALTPSTPGDLVAVMSAIARTEDDIVILNVMGFCPLRAALQRRRGIDPLALARDAVENRGFVGIKLYPPMGFTPSGNRGSFRSSQGGTVNGAELNAELRALFRWCAANEVPIKTHGNNSLAAGVCTGVKAAPRLWRPVLATHPDLRVNIAHFGGFEESRSPVPGCPAQPRDWEIDAAELAAQSRNFFVDLGFWSGVTAMEPGARPDIIARTRALVKRYPALGQQLLYGSDWLMTGRIPGHAAYLRDVQATITELPLDTTAVMSTNALRYLGLDRRGAQYRRLARFFSPRHRFHRLFPPT